MADASVNDGSKGGYCLPIKELDVLWITAGLGCDGETIAMTAATPCRCIFPA